MSYFVSKIGHLDPVSTVLYTAIPGVQMSGVQMSDSLFYAVIIQNINTTDWARTSSF